MGELAIEQEAEPVGSERGGFVGGPRKVSRRARLGETRIFATTGIVRDGKEHPARFHLQGIKSGYQGSFRRDQGIRFRPLFGIRSW